MDETTRADDMKAAGGKLDEDQMIKADDTAPAVESQAMALNEPKSVVGEEILENTNQGFDRIPAESEDEAEDEESESEDESEDGDSDSTKAVVFFGGSTKALGNGRVGGYIVSYGSPGDTDLSGEYFDRQTNFHFDDGYPVKGEPLLFHHGLDKTMGIKRIGVIDKVTVDDVGIWAEGVLNLHDEYEKAIYRLVEQGKLGWSSGALPQGVRVTRAGYITDWPITEGSLTPMPMQPFKTTITPVKALPEVDIVSTAVETDTQTPIRTIPPSGEATMTLIQERMVDAVMSAYASATKTTLTEDEAASVRAEALKAFTALGEDPADDKIRDYAKSGEFIDLVEKLVRQTTAADDVMTAVQSRITSKSQPQPQATGFSDKANISVRSKYADLSAADMAFLALARKGVAAHQNYIWHEDNYDAEMIAKAQKGLNDGSIKLSLESMKAVSSLKSNELHHTTNTGYGAEWVAELWSTDLWQKERMENVVASRIRTIDLPSDPYKLPLESNDPTIYHVPETTDESQLLLDGAGTPIPDSKMGTKNLQIATEKIGGRVMFSTEITEDSIIPFAPQLRGQLMRAIADQIDYTILNGDTHIGTASVSYKGGTTVATQVFTAFDGIRKHALAQVNGTINQNGTITLEALRTLRFKLPNPLAVNIANLVMFVDVQTYGKLLSLDALNIWYNNGRNATVNTGTVPMIDGIPVIPSNELTMADTTGYISVTGANNSKGQLLLVPLNQWIMGYRRRVSATVEFLSFYDSYQMTATARIGMVNRDLTTAVNAAVMYNITVT